MQPIKIRYESGEQEQPEYKNQDMPGGFQSKESNFRFGMKNQVPEKETSAEMMKVEIEFKKQFEHQNSFKIQGHCVYYPFKPYGIQENYMSKVIEALKEN